MLCFVVLAILGSRRPTVSEIMILMLAGVLLVDPLSVLSGGFWLSFGAVFVIALCLRRPVGKLNQGVTDRMRYRLVDWVRIQLGIFIGMMPLLILIFGQISVVAPLANLVAVPVVGALVVPPALLGLVALGFGWESIALVIFQFPLWVLSVLWPVLEFLGETQRHQAQ